MTYDELKDDEEATYRGEAKHTPGPWTYDPTKPFFCTTDPDVDIVSTVGLVARTAGHQPGPVDDEGRANARLIAAAPDLRQAVAHVLDASKDCGGMNDIDWEELRAAIAKAGG